MTNDPYLYLRIALACGKCVTDKNGNILRYAPVFVEKLHRPLEYWGVDGTATPYGRRWFTPIEGLEFNEDSRIVPDPSLPPRQSQKRRGVNND